MSPAYIEYRKKQVLDNIASGKGHQTVEYQNEAKKQWTEKDDKRKRVA